MNTVADLIRDLELWKPQREGLEAFHAVVEGMPLGKGVAKATSIGTAAGQLQKQIDVKRFDMTAELASKDTTTFPSFCFAIATGGGKTRLMGACIAYLYKTKGFKNFFILSKGKTVYQKHVEDDFEPSSEKYVFKGLDDFPTPRIVDADNYERFNYPDLFSDDLTLYIFHIAKFGTRSQEQRKFFSFKETIGQSIAKALKELPDLVFLMDESHNVRAEVSLDAINDLSPILGLEFTATPKAANVIYDYPLKQAVEDGLVKRPVVLTRRDDESLAEENEDIKLRDGIRRHERKKALLKTFCANKKLEPFKPRVLISTRDIAHSGEVAEKIQDKAFFGGRYKDKVLVVHSGSEDEQIQKLTDLEKTDNDIEIVVHVNKLKEGWDVKSVYTIIPLRATVSELLAEQTMGRGLRLPFGWRVSHNPGLSDEEKADYDEIDQLDIITHERYSAVLASAEKFIGVRAIGEEESEVVPVKIAPDGNKRYRLDIPKVRTDYKTSGKIDWKDVKVSYEALPELDPELVGTDLASSLEQTYEKIREKHPVSSQNYYVRFLIESGEFDMRDKKDLQKFVKAYFEKAAVPSGEKEKVLYDHRRKVLKDMLDQLREKERATTKIAYRALKENIDFREYWRNFNKGKEKVIAKEAATDSDCAKRLIGGYEKTIFPVNVFDSKPEKLFADVLNKDKEVKRWVRPPIGQMTIHYRHGTYNPDFVVETRGGKFCVVEIKAESEIGNQDVKEKAQAAIKWCKAQSQATGKTWEYKLVPDTAVQATSSFRGIIANAVSV